MSAELSLWSVALLSGLGAGLVATLATVAIEKLGGQLGGVIGTLPTTIIPASWGIWSQLPIRQAKRSGASAGERAKATRSCLLYTSPSPRD